LQGFVLLPLKVTDNIASLFADDLEGYDGLIAFLIRRSQMDDLTGQTELKHAPGVRKESSAIKVFNQGDFTQFILEYLGIKSEAVQNTSLVAYVDNFLTAEMAPGLAQKLNPGDLLVGVWAGALNRNVKPPLFDRLFREKHIKVKDMRGELISDAELRRLLGPSQGPSLLISRLGEMHDFGQTWKGGVKVKFDMTSLDGHGVDLIEAIGLVKQLADHPESFHKAGFKMRDGFFEVGDNLVILLEKVYSEFVAAQKTARAA